MESFKIKQGSLMVFIFCLLLCFDSFASIVYVYDDSFDLRIPAEPPNPEDPNSKGWMNDAIIEIPDNLTIEDIDVSIDVTHTNVFDLQIFLKSPVGTRILLNMYDFKTEFEIYPNYTDTIFDDEANVPIELAEPPFTGRFRPKAPYMLEAFDGEDAFGPWRLQIYDAYYYDTGHLNSFGIMITVPEPATAVLLTLGTGLAVLLKSHRKPYFLNAIRTMQ